MSDIDINHEVNRMRQPDANSCWATCIAMKIGVAHRRCYSIEGIKSTAASAGVEVYEDGSVAMDVNNMDLLGMTFNIRILRNAGTVYINHLLPTLRRSPVILFGAFSTMGGSTTNHAVILHQMFGDGSESTGIALVDPYNASPGFDPTNDFVCSWGDLCTTVITRLDYVSSLV